LSAIGDELERFRRKAFVVRCQTSLQIGMSTFVKHLKNLNHLGAWCPDRRQPVGGGAAWKVVATWAGGSAPIRVGMVGAWVALPNGSGAVTG
jgi:hypothetical protein